MTCPHHGTVSQPLAYVSPELARSHRSGFQGLEFLGRGAVRLDIGPAGFEIAGRLNLNPFQPKPVDQTFTCINNLRQIDAGKE